MGNQILELAALRDETRDMAKSYGLDFAEDVDDQVEVAEQASGAGGLTCSDSGDQSLVTAAPSWRSCGQTASR